MEDAFKKLQNDNQNTVDNLIKWMKNCQDKSSRRLIVGVKLINNISAKLVDGIKVTEDKARQMFADVTDASNVEFSKFQEVIENLANEQKKSVDELSKILAVQGPRFLNAAKAAASAAATAAATAAASSFKDAFTKK